MTSHESGQSPLSPLSSSPLQAAAYPWGAPVPAAEDPSQAPSSGPSVLSIILKALKRSWLLGLTTAVITATAAWFLIPSKSTALALLQLSPNQPHVVFVGVEGTISNQIEFESFKKTQETLLLSDAVIQSALTRPEVAALATISEQSDPVSWLQENLTVSFTGTVMSVTLSGRNAEDLPKIVNAVVSSYMKQIVDVEKNRRLERLSQIKTLYTEQKENLALRRRALREKAETAGSRDQKALAIRQQMAYENLGKTEADKLLIHRKVSETEILLKQLEAQKTGKSPVAKAVDASVIDEAMAGDLELTQEREDLGTLDEKYHKLRASVRSASDPALIAVAGKRRALKEKIAARELSLRGKLEAEYQRMPGNDLDEQISQTKLDLDRLKQLEASVQRDVDQQVADAKSFNTNALDLESVEKEIEMVEETAKQIGTEVQKLSVETQAASRVTSIATADRVRHASSKRHVTISGAAAFGGFVLILLGFCLRESHVQRIETSSDLTSSLGMPVVGVLPALPGPAGTRALSTSKRHRERFLNALLIESVDATRMSLLHASRTSNVQVMMVTSAQMGEGKTSLSCHLAGSLARAGRSTLLLDCDLRNPNAHQVLDLPLEPGVCEILRGEADLQEAIWPTAAGGLSMITAGRCDPRAIQALLRGDLGPILTRLRQQFDFIVVDSAPVLPVADTLQVSQHVDAAVFSVLRDVSRIPLVNLAYQRLNRLNVRLLGAVVAGANARHMNSHYTYVNAPYINQPEEENAS
ncbi:MAG: hypothetical protein KGM43_06510 [Planctomycetota bacterium]|nr:hypothetical protein [Planctomycetota bacterium]